MKIELTRELANDILDNTSAAVDNDCGGGNVLSLDMTYKLLSIADYDYVDEFVNSVHDVRHDNQIDKDADIECLTLQPSLNSPNKYERIVAKRRLEHK